MQLHILEYSPSQDAYHLCTKKDREFNEAVLKAKGVESDWEIVEEFTNETEARNFIYELKVKSLACG